MKVMFSDKPGVIEVVEAKNVTVDTTVRDGFVIVTVELLGGQLLHKHLPMHFHDNIIKSISSSVIDLTNKTLGNDSSEPKKLSEYSIPPVDDYLGTENSAKVLNWFNSLSQDELVWLRDNFGTFYNCCNSAAKNPNTNAANYFLGDFRCKDVYDIQQSLSNRPKARKVLDSNTLQ